MTLAASDDNQRFVFRAKWRANDTASVHSIPRREIVAYEIQKLFLDPMEYVVTPTRAQCFGLEQYREQVDPQANSALAELDCIFGYLSYWLEDASRPDDVNVDWFDPDRGFLDVDLFHENARYRSAISNLNLLTYLIDHDDSHQDQFLMRPGRKRPIIYSIDNSMSFQSATNPLLGRLQDWSKIQMPLPKAKVERLRELEPEDLFQLRIMQRFQLHDGRLVSVETGGDTKLEAEKPLRWQGEHFLVGSSEFELEQLWDRLQVLLRRVDEGRVLVYGED